ncbi:MAG: RNA polymerase sigma factor [Gemmataceae bacterium]
MSRLRGGDEQAAAEVFRRFARRLIGLAGSRLHGMIRQKVDPEDVMQSVFKSFFRRHAEGQFDLESWDSLWSLLTVLTLRKCGCRIRYYQAARRDVQREMPPAPVHDGAEASPWEAIAREPTPTEVMQLTETVEQLFRDMDPRDREIVELALQGYKAQEISTKVRLTERTVYRVLNRVKKKLQRWNSVDDA